MPANVAACDNPSRMKLQINGEPREFTAPLALSALLEQLGMKADRVAVELNHGIVPREQWAETILGDVPAARTRKPS